MPETGGAESAVWVGTLSLGQALSVPFSPLVSALGGFPAGARGKEPAHQCRRHKKLGFDPWFRKVPWGREWQPTSVFLPGELHGHRSVISYRSWDHKESDMIERLTLSLSQEFNRGHL